MDLSTAARFRTEAPGWTYEEWFEPVVPVAPSDAVLQCEAYVDEVRIGEHPFFAIGAESPEALRVWVTQELVVTGQIARLMLAIASRITNVHLRARMTYVAWGEHHAVRTSGVANRSHPWLLHQLGRSMGIGPREVRPMDETLAFLDVIEQDCETVLGGVASLGVGNEHLIIPEYTAVGACFERSCPDIDASIFLNANIEEDLRHSQLLRDLGAALIEAGADPDLYLLAGRRSVDARLEYYDRLVDRVS
jgi:hypothetical protein